MKSCLSRCWSAPDREALRPCAGVARREFSRSISWEVVALVGDNGAGKSTLVKTMVGVHPPDGGEILFEGKQVTVNTPHDARDLGIETVYQDLALAAEVDPAANMFLGREILRPGLLGKFGFLDKPAMRHAATRPSIRSGFASRTRARASRTCPAASVRASPSAVPSHGRARSSSWTSRRRRSVSSRRATSSTLIRRVREHGLSIVLISHNLPEVFEVADRIEVLRLGERVAQLRPKEVSMEDVVAAMTGALTFHEGDQQA